MSAQRPNFTKKEVNLSGTPYLYLPVDINAFAVEVSHRDEIDGELLQRALDKTIERMPYVTDTLTIDHGAVYYADNPLPMEVAHTAKLRRVGGAETNYHMLDVTWDGNKTWFSMFHGFCDGQGVYTFTESVLYHYYCLKDGVDYDSNGIRTAATQMTDAETVDMYAKTYEVSPDFVMPDRSGQVVPYHLPEIVADTHDTIREYGFRLPSDTLMAAVRENGTSPSVMISMLVGEAIQRLHPDADAPIMVNIPISRRRMLQCDETFKNCSGRAVLPVGGTPLDALPFAQRAAQLRGMLRQQMSPDLSRASANMISGMHRKQVEEATDYQEEIRKPAGLYSISHDTFYVDYIGSMHETAYANQMTGVRFLCNPLANSTLHLNVIEHGGQFCIACLCSVSSDAAPLMDALEQVVQEHGLPVERTPEQSFDLPRVAWREGLV